jgi:hypothetical protein
MAAASGLSTATISFMLSGRPVAARSARAVAHALDKHQPVAGLAELLGGPGEAA